MFQRLRKHQFLFEELVKRDFKNKYKRTVLGMAWSVLSPLLTLLVMKLVFTQFRIFLILEATGVACPLCKQAAPVFL